MVGATDQEQPPPRVGSVRTVLAAQAARSAAVVICAALLGIVVDDLAPARLLVALLLSAVVVSVWAKASETDRLTRLAERASAWPSETRPRWRTRPNVFLTALLPTPFAALILWLLGQVPRLWDSDPSIWLGALCGLVAGLAFLRLRLATRITQLEAQRNYTPLAGRVGIRKTDPIWTLPH